MAVSDQPWYAERRPSPAKTAFPDPRRLPPRHCRGDRLPIVGRPLRSRPRPFLSRPLCGGAKSKYDVARLGVQREHGAEMARKKLGQYFCVVYVYSSPFTTTPSSRPPFDDRVCIVEISPPQVWSNGVSEELGRAHINRDADGGSCAKKKFQTATSTTLYSPDVSRGSRRRYGC